MSLSTEHLIACQLNPGYKEENQVVPALNSLPGAGMNIQTLSWGTHNTTDLFKVLGNHIKGTLI